jgi:hypothetical protein
MERTVVRLSTAELSTATLNGWNLTFNVEDSPELKRVTVSGQNGNAYVNATATSEGVSNVGFSQGSADVTLAAALLEEMEAILNPVEEE